MRYFSFILLVIGSLTFVNTKADTDLDNHINTKLVFKGVSGELLDNVKQYVRLSVELKLNNNLGSSQFKRLKNNVVEEVKSALEPFGYYNSDVKLTSEPKSTTLTCLIDLKQPVVVESLNLHLNDLAKSQKEFTLWVKNYPFKKGDRFDHAIYESAKKNILSIALRLGYFDAQFKESSVLINKERTQASVTQFFNSGVRYKLGDVVTQWKSDDGLVKESDHVNQDLLDPLIHLYSGNHYYSDRLVSTQKALLTTPYFVNVSVQAKEPNQKTGLVDIVISLTPKNKKSYSIEAGAGTDTGPRAGVAYENYRVNRKGHNLSVRFGTSQIKQSANINYRIPLARRAKDSLDFFSTLEQEDGDTREFSSTKIGSELSIAWRKSFLKYSLTASRERSSSLNEQLIDVDEEVDLLIPSFRWEQNNTDDELFPRKGWSASGLIQFADQALLSDVDFIQALVEFKSLYPVGNGKIKFRIKAGVTIIDDAVNLPESIGFLAGGNDSIRGYSFESIGVERNGEAVVASDILVASLEYQHPIRNSLALAIFADIGDAFDDTPDYQTGAGLGLRWQLPFGALRLDVASALSLEDRPLRLHFSFGADL